VTRVGGLDAESGLVSYDTIKNGVLLADADAEITSIVLDFHSPGGAASGAIECADVIHRIAQKRPVIAVCNSLCASAAYLLAAAATKIVTTKTATVGSIGVVMLHVDRSQQLAGSGIVPTFVFSGKHKIDANELQPLTDAVKSDLQTEVDQFYALMIGSIAEHRPKLSEAAIRATEAKTYLGIDAVTQGLADEVGTLETAVTELAKLHPVATAPFNRTEFIYGKAQATKERLDQERAAGVRAGMAAALAGRT
jgi:signal peptide peptidase SppA